MFFKTDFCVETMSYKGGYRFLKLRTPQLKTIKTENDTDFLKTYMYSHKNYYQPI